MPKRLTVLISVTVGIIALLAGVFAISQRNTQYSAEASVVIVPITKDPTAAIDAIDSLNRTGTVSTLAQAFAGDTNVRQAYGTAGITPAEAARVSVATSIVADSWKILITGTSGDARLAERAADAVANSKPDLGAYNLVFEPKVYGIAQGTAAKSGPGGGLLSLMALFVAGGLALLTFVALSRLSRAGHLSNLGGMLGLDDRLEERRDERRRVKVQRERDDVDRERLREQRVRERQSERRAVPASRPDGPGESVATAAPPAESAALADIPEAVEPPQPPVVRRPEWTRVTPPAAVSEPTLDPAPVVTEVVAETPAPAQVEVPEPVASEPEPVAEPETEPVAAAPEAEVTGEAVDAEAQVAGEPTQTGDRSASAQPGAARNARPTPRAPVNSARARAQARGTQGPKGRRSR